MKALLITDSFADWKRYLWQSANLPILGRHKPYMKVPKLGNAIPEHLKIEVISRRNCTYLTVSENEYAIPEH